MVLKKILTHIHLQILDTPVMAISFVYNNVPQKISMKLPLTLNKFFEPTEMNGESFFARWKNLGGYVNYLNCLCCNVS